LPQAARAKAATREARMIDLFMWESSRVMGQELELRRGALCQCQETHFGKINKTWELHPLCLASEYIAG
jgi:hypothetical protein